MKTLIAAIRESPSIRRLCGWESVSDIPHESQFSRAFRDFAGDDIGSKALAACLAENLGHNGLLVRFSLPVRKETALNCLPMASKTVFASAFAFIFHASSSSSRAAHHLGHPQIKIYTLYTFYTAAKRGFAITSYIMETCKANGRGGGI